MTFYYFAVVAAVLGFLLLIRILYVIHQCGKQLRQKSPKSYSTLIVLGSGGHTAEMLNLLSLLQKDSFTPRFYIAAATDNMSLQKARVMENSINNTVSQGLGAYHLHCNSERTLYMQTYRVFSSDALFYLEAAALTYLFFCQYGEKTGDSARYMQIYRSREVGQSYITSVGTTLFAIAHALHLMIQLRPQVIVCNGPGTCIPLCTIAFVFKVIGIRWSSIFYVESIARVRRLSLSGLLLYKLRMADQFFVQWPQLKKQYPRSEYVGRLM